ncbi:MAG: MBL fold metallo-hydrolase [Desulfuromonadales bacterium]|nr:MBL fold metallo-hydrolase [Desulfuromonadales bacterium]
MIVHKLSVGPLQVNCFVVACTATRKAMVVDPGEEGSRILEVINEGSYSVQCIVNTHGHFDHIGANRYLVEATGAELMVHRDDASLYQTAEQHASLFGLTSTPSPEADRLLEDGDRIEFGELSFDVLHVPGHSPGGICLFCQGHLFAGDVLFAGSIGRTDLQGGDHDALVAGIRKKLFALPDETLVHTGHGPDTTLGQEKRSNPFVGDPSGY